MKSSKPTLDMYNVELALKRKANTPTYNKCKIRTF